jgi:protein gp37
MSVESSQLLEHTGYTYCLRNYYFNQTGARVTKAEGEAMVGETYKEKPVVMP